MGDTQEVRVSGTVFSETIRNLRPSTTYLFSIIAENEVGQGEPSEVSNKSMLSCPK